MRSIRNFFVVCFPLSVLSLGCLIKIFVWESCMSKEYCFFQERKSDSEREKIKELLTFKGGKREKNSISFRINSFKFSSLVLNEFLVLIFQSGLPFFSCERKFPGSWHGSFYLRKYPRVFSFIFVGFGSVEVVRPPKEENLGFVEGERSGHKIIYTISLTDFFSISSLKSRKKSNHTELHLRLRVKLTLSRAESGDSESPFSLRHILCFTFLPSRVLEIDNIFIGLLTPHEEAKNCSKSFKFNILLCTSLPSLYAFRWQGGCFWLIQN